MTWGQAWEDPLTRHQATLMFHVTTNPKLNGIQRVHNTVPPGPARLLKLSCVLPVPWGQLRVCTIVSSGLITHRAL